MLQITCLVLGLVPLIWSGLVVWAQRFSKNAPDDRSEKICLIIMLAPILAGFCMMAWAEFMPLPTIAPVFMPSTAIVTQSHPMPGAAVFAAAQIQSLSAILRLAITIYAFVAIWQGGRLLAVQVRLKRIVALSTEDTLEDVRLTDANVPAFAWGRSVIVLPRGLSQALSSSQLDMLIRHERGHQMRGDIAYYALLSWLEVVIWFNPFVRSQIKRCRLAVELACDALAMENNDDAQARHDYAASLLAAMKHASLSHTSASTIMPAMASLSNMGDFQTRLAAIMRRGDRNHRPARRWGYILMAFGVTGATLTQFAWAQGIDARPLEKDGGIYAAGSGIVTKVDIDQNASVMMAVDPEHTFHATSIEIDHGEGTTSTYQVLGGTRLKVGDHVAAGAFISTEGLPAVVHVHFVPGVFKTCAIGKVCAMYGQNGRDNSDGSSTMWGKVTLKTSSRIIKADIIFKDRNNETFEGHDHVLIGDVH